MAGEAFDGMRPLRYVVMRASEGEVFPMVELEGVGEAAEARSHDGR